MSKAAKICAILVNTAESGSENWVRIKKSTTLSVTMNPETETFDYIADEFASEELKSYKPSINQDLAVYKDEPDFAFFYNLYKKLPTGSDAHREFLLVYLLDGDASAGYYSQKIEGILSFSSFDAVAGTLNFDINLSGTPVSGKTKVSEGVFTFTADSGASA